MSNDNLRAAITAALRRRDPNADLDVSTTCTPLGAWGSLAGGVIRGPDGALIDVVARASDDAKALRGVAFAVGLRDDGSDPAEEVHRLRAELAETERRLNAEISAMDARDGAYQALDGARDGSDELVALAECRMAEIRRLRAELALERERCVELVREIPACQPGARATATRRWLDDRVAACVRAIEVDDETATCARASVREARERAKAAEADVARLEFALQCEATRHEETRAAVRGYLAAEAACDAAHVGSLYVQGERDSDEVDAAADRIVAAIKAQDAARDALRKIVEGE